MGTGHAFAPTHTSSTSLLGQRRTEPPWPTKRKIASSQLFAPPPDRLYEAEILGERGAAQAHALRKYGPETRACLLSHISPRGFRRAWSKDYDAPRLLAAGRVVQVKMPAPNHRGGGKRGRVEVWSWQSRRNLMRQMGAVEWDNMLPSLFLTLTYPGLAPDDGAIVKKHLEAFKKRWQRRWKVKATGAWKMEFQRRGVAHFHLCLQLPETLWAEGMEGGDDLTSIRQWLSLAWYEVVGSGDIRHYNAGTECDWVRKDVATYFAGYSCGACKEYQNTPPTAYPNIGRWWGLWNCRPEWEEQELTQREAIHAKRCMKRMRIAARRSSSDAKVRKRRTRSVGWVVGGRETGALLAQLMQAIGGLVQHDQQTNKTYFRPYRERDLTRFLMGDTLEQLALIHAAQRN